MEYLLKASPKISTIGNIAKEGRFLLANYKWDLSGNCTGSVCEKQLELVNLGKTSEVVTRYEYRKDENGNSFRNAF